MINPMLLTRLTGSIVVFRPDAITPAERIALSSLAQRLNAYANGQTEWRYVMEAFEKARKENPSAEFYADFGKELEKLAPIS